MANSGTDGKLNDEECMREAIVEAEAAARMNEVPVGAVAVADGRIVARAHNIRETTQDPLGHAEMLLIRKLTTPSPLVGEGGGEGEGEVQSSNWRLTEITIYVTCEPCLMCMGAMLQARIHRVVYGCKDPKAGACGSLYDVSNDARLNHRIAVTADVLGMDCGKLLSDFFRSRRKSPSPL